MASAANRREGLPLVSTSPISHNGVSKKRGLHVPLEIMRGAGQQRAKDQDDEAADGDVQEQQMPIRLAVSERSWAHGTFDRGPSLAQDARKQHEHDQIERKQKSQRRIDRLAETDQRRLEAVRLGKRRHGRPIQRDEIVPARNEPSDERRGDRSGRADAQQQAPVEQARAQHRLPQRGGKPAPRGSRRSYIC
jgi:hypothetical protein